VSVAFKQIQDIDDRSVLDRLLEPVYGKASEYLCARSTDH